MSTINYSSIHLDLMQYAFEVNEVMPHEIDEHELGAIIRHIDDLHDTDDIDDVTVLALIVSIKESLFMDLHQSASLFFDFLDENCSEHAIYKEALPILLSDVTKYGKVTLIQAVSNAMDYSSTLASSISNIGTLDKDNYPMLDMIIQNNTSDEVAACVIEKISPITDDNVNAIIKGNHHALLEMILPHLAKTVQDNPSVFFHAFLDAINSATKNQTDSDAWHRETRQMCGFLISEIAPLNSEILDTCYAKLIEAIDNKSLKYYAIKLIERRMLSARAMSSLFVRALNHDDIELVNEVTDAAFMSGKKITYNKKAVSASVIKHGAGQSLLYMIDDKIFEIDDIGEMYTSVCRNGDAHILRILHSFERAPSFAYHSMYKKAGYCTDPLPIISALFLLYPQKKGDKSYVSYLLTSLSLKNNIKGILYVLNFHDANPDALYKAMHCAVKKNNLRLFTILIEKGVAQYDGKMHTDELINLALRTKNIKMLSAVLEFCLKGRESLSVKNVNDGIARANDLPMTKLLLSVAPMHARTHAEILTSCAKEHENTETVSQYILNHALFKYTMDDLERFLSKKYLTKSIGSPKTCYDALTGDDCDNYTRFVIKRFHNNTKRKILDLIKASKPFEKPYWLEIMKNT